MRSSRLWPDRPRSSWTNVTAQRCWQDSPNLSYPMATHSWWCHGTVYTILLPPSPPIPPVQNKCSIPHGESSPMCPSSCIQIHQSSNAQDQYWIHQGNDKSEALSLIHPSSSRETSPKPWAEQVNSVHQFNTIPTVGLLCAFSSENTWLTHWRALAASEREETTRSRIIQSLRREADKKATKPQPKADSSENSMGKTRADALLSPLWQEFNCQGTKALTDSESDAATCRALSANPPCTL